MGIAFSPSRDDVDRYQRLRKVNVELNSELVKTIPSEAYEEIGNALGLRHSGMLILDDEDFGVVLLDSCLYDWYRNGKNRVQRYAEEHAADPGNDVGYILRACLFARYRILIPESMIPGAGAYCRDILSGTDLFLMDIGLSQNSPAKIPMGVRTIPVGEYWMSSGAALAIDRDADIEGAMSEIESQDGALRDGPAIMPVAIIRACIAAYRSHENVVEGRRREPRPQWKRRRRSAGYIGRR